MNIGQRSANGRIPAATAYRGCLALLLLAIVGVAVPVEADESGDLATVFARAKAAQAKADYAEAVLNYQRALQLVGGDPTNRAVVLNNLGSAYDDLGKYPEALRAYNECLKLKEANLGPSDLDVASTVNNLATLYHKLGDYDKADANYRRSLNIKMNKLKPDDPAIAVGFNNLAVLFKERGQRAQAEPYLLRALKIYEAAYGPNHIAVAETCTNLANLYDTLGLYAKAEPLYLRSLGIKRTNLGEDHPDVADSLQNLASFYEDLQEYEKAEPIARQALAIYKKTLDADHPKLAQCQSNLALICKKLGHYDQSEQLYLSSLKIREAKLGTSHPDVAISANNLAMLYERMEQLDKAEPLYQRSLKIVQAKFPAGHPMEQTILYNLAVLHAASDRTEQAADEFNSSRRLKRQYVARVLPILSEAEQLSFLEGVDRHEFHASLTLGWAHPDDHDLATRTAGWLANGKAVAQECLAQRAALARDAKTAELKTIVDLLNASRRQLANLMNTAAAAGSEQSARNTANQLAERTENLAKQLVRAGEASSPAVWVELDDVRKNIAAEALLIDIVRFTPAEFGFKKDDPRPHTARYAAWVTPPAGRGDVQVVDLGEAEKIDAAVQKFQELFRTYQSADKATNPLLALGEVDAEKQLQTSLGELRRLVLDPLLPRIKDTQELIVCGDAALCLVPWSILPLDEGQYAIEKWDIHYVTAARDLAAPRLPGSTNPPRIFANPNYDLAATELPQALASVLYGGAVPRQNPVSPVALGAPANAELRNRSSGAIGPVTRLPGTAREAEAIMPNLKTLSGAEPKLYADRQALEGVFKRLRPPRILVISTHGYFLSDQSVADQSSQGEVLAAGRPNSPALLTANGSKLENPLLRCGLLLAGCNQRDQIPLTSDLDDGVLTGMEIVGTDLRGTELVVLSACETGLGQVNNGEGVSGLRQAFQLAGAQSVVSTLWQIPDQATAQLMNDFFANLANGQSKSQALRNAQLTRIKARREKFGAAHPMFWAAFTLTGR